jgi:hypothetical protein
VVRFELLDEGSIPPDEAPLRLLAHQPKGYASPPTTA